MPCACPTLTVVEEVSRSAAGVQRWKNAVSRRKCSGMCRRSFEEGRKSGSRREPRGPSMRRTGKGSLPRQARPRQPPDGPVRVGPMGVLYPAVPFLTAAVVASPDGDLPPRPVWQQACCHHSIPILLPQYDAATDSIRRARGTCPGCVFFAGVQKRDARMRRQRSNTTLRQSTNDPLRSKHTYSLYSQCFFFFFFLPGILHDGLQKGMEFHHLLFHILGHDGVPH